MQWQPSSSSYVLTVASSFADGKTDNTGLISNVPLICPFPVRKLKIEFSNVYTVHTATTTTACPFKYQLYLVCDKFTAPLISCGTNNSATVEYDFGGIPRPFSELVNMSLRYCTTGAGGNKPTTQFTCDTGYYLDCTIRFTFEA